MLRDALISVEYNWITVKLLQQRLCTRNCYPPQSNELKNILNLYHFFFHNILNYRKDLIP